MAWDHNGSIVGLKPDVMIPYGARAAAEYAIESPWHALVADGEIWLVLIHRLSGAAKTARSTD